MHGLHQDIKGNNIFVSQAQKRFVLGDFGLSSKLSDTGDAAFSGMTFGYASPEQAAESQRITPASDIFSRCVTAINDILQADPEVGHAWAQAYPDRPMPYSLFPTMDSQIAPAFASWARFSEGDSTLKNVTENFELTYSGGERAGVLKIFIWKVSAALPM